MQKRRYNAAMQAQITLSGAIWAAGVFVAGPLLLLALIVWVAAVLFL